jgi:hypothetical protein
MRRCKTCGEEKLLSAFPEPNRHECRVCRNAKRKAVYRAARGGIRHSRWDAIRLTPEEARARNLASQRRSKLRLKYGMTVEQYAAMDEAQGGKCAICGGDGPLTVDHCHRTTQIRSLLCDAYNKGLGHFRDNPELLRKAAEYLELAGNSIVPQLAAQFLAAVLEVTPPA